MLRIELIVIALAVPMAAWAEERPARTETFNIVQPTGDSYAVADGDSLILNGTSDGAAKLRQRAAGLEGNYIWFERNGREYVIEDAGFVQKGVELVGPQKELGRRQAATGATQTQVGHEQSRVAREAGGSPDALKELVRLRGRMRELQSRGDVQAQAEMSDLRLKVRQIETRLNQQPGAGAQGALAEKQSALADQESDMSDQQVKLAGGISSKMRSLIDEAAAAGKTRRL